jgi:hypothetical protein
MVAPLLFPGLCIIIGLALFVRFLSPDVATCVNAAFETDTNKRYNKQNQFRIDDSIGPTVIVTLRQFTISGHLLHR